MPRTSSIPSKMKPKRQADTPKNIIGNGIDREELISVAAYFRAKNRGFEGGDSMADWLAAEAEIDAMLINHKNVNIH